MADESTDNRQEKKEDADKKRKNTLEEKSKEELVILVKKYLNLLQKSKNKTDELNKKCLVLEQNKSSADEAYQSCEKELLSKIDALQHSISESTAEKLSLTEKDQEIEELKQKLKAASEGKNKHALSTRENEEQLQCLNLQLQSLKASCQCIQEENQKLLKSNKEKLEEINSLLVAKDALSSDFNKKVEEYDVLLNIKKDTEEKYEKAVEEIHSLQSKADKIITENNELKKNIKSLNDKIRDSECDKKNENDIVILMQDIQRYKKKSEDLEKQIEILKSKSPNLQTLNENKTQNFSIDEIESKTVDSIKKTYKTTLEENLSLKDKNMAMKSELDECNKHIQKLQEEIKTLASVSELGDYKMGIELALLQGAAIEGLIYPNERQNVRFENNQPNAPNFHKKTEETFKNENMYLIENNTSGLEYALLQGGDTSKLIVANSEYCAQIPENEFVDPMPLLKKDEESEYKTLLEKTILELEDVKRKLREYSSLYNETLEENESLKKRLQEFEDKKFINQETNTDSKKIKCIEELEKGKDSKTDDKTKPFSCEGHEERELCENYNHLCNEIICLYENMLLLRKLVYSEKEISCDPLAILQSIHDLYEKVISDLQIKSCELNESNLQLELLIIGIKQGVRQKTSAPSYQTENNLKENMNLLKILLDDLILRSNCYSSKIKNLESDAFAEKKKMEEELAQLKELNQFLEVENRELNNEVKKLKYNLSIIENFNNVTSFGEVYQKSSELYSIEESNEFDDKSDSTANLISSDKLAKKFPNVSDISVQTFCSVKDSVAQVESNVFSCEVCDVVTENSDAVVQTDLKDDNCELVLEQLTTENNSLKKLISEKNCLVEDIHCQIDSLLTKNEELSVELQNKEDDLKYSQSLNVDLKKMLTDVQNIQSQQHNVLKVAQNLMLEFKMDNSNLNEELKSFILTYKELMTTINNDIMKVITLKCKNYENFQEMCIHKETNFNIIKDWIVKFTTDFECLFNLLGQMATEASLIDISELERFIQNSSENFSLFDSICDNGTCCLILESISHLNSYKLKLFSCIYNHLENYNSLVSNLHSSKLTIPNMEKNLAELEKKLAGCTCQDNTKEVKYIKSDVTTESSLKDSLAETEIKMNKLKQLAMKLKKELALSKEQFNNITSENEKLQKQNGKLLEELNKVTENQCMYVQNYQSVQNEFDKLQDEYEMHKLNAKKIEEGLATKLQELTSSKEQVLELESQLKLSNQLLESISCVKKELDIKCVDLESKVIVLESKISEKEQKISSLTANINKHLKDLNAAWEDNKNLKDQLESAQKEGNKKSLLDLEMADYERSILELNVKIERKDDEIEELQNEIKSLTERYDCLQEEIKSTETLKEIETKRAESLKEILEKTKSELNKVKEHEAELLSKTASFEVQFETMAQQEEGFKLRLSEASSQIQHLQDAIKASSENHQRIVRSFEQKISNQKEEIILAHKEVESVKQEFENYKIRVHSVLKQQKTVSPAITTIDGDLKEKLEAMNEKLKLQVKDLSEKLTASSLEYKTLQEENDSLFQRYNKVIDDREQKDKEWHQRLELVNAEKNRLRATQEELSSQHLLQNEMLVATYKKQIKIMSEEHKRIVNDLQKQLDNADFEIARLQRDQQKLQGLPVAPLLQDNSTSLDIMSQERQEGEGSESTDETTTPIRHLSLATIPSSGFLSFEKLIQSPLESGTPSSYISNADSEKLTADLNTANKKIDHLSEILNDSESTNLRLSEQVRVLKEEVRRLENNKEREQHAENLEYLKNVFIKFSSLQPGNEKATLLPVLTTMLKLNPNEQQQLKSVAGDLDSDDNLNPGWGSYLHRWSGLS